MKIEKNKVVVLTYTAQADGLTVDHAPENRPLDYIQGFHMLIPKFEEELEGKEDGDSFAFEVGPADAYGEYDPAHRFDIPKDSFSVDGKLREDLLVEGRVIPMLNGAGEVCMAQIIEIKDSDVTVDFNHPMAGKNCARACTASSSRPRSITAAGTGKADAATTTAKEKAIATGTRARKAKGAAITAAMKTKVAAMAMAKAAATTLKATDP